MFNIEIVNAVWLFLKPFLVTNLLPILKPSPVINNLPTLKPFLVTNLLPTLKPSLVINALPFLGLDIAALPLLKPTPFSYYMPINS